MEKAETVVDVLAVQYPSNHSFVEGLKIAFIGKKTQWKQELIDALIEFITDKPLTFFYVNDDKYDHDKISWMYNNLLHCDYRVMYVSDDIEDLVFIGPYVKDKKTFLIFDEGCPDNITSMYKILNPNKTATDLISVVSAIKQA